MKFLLRLLPLAVLLCALPVAHADDLSGTWKGTFDYQGSPVPTTLNLKIDGATVTGTVEGLPTSPAPIEEGKLNGNTVSFWVNTDYQGQSYTVQYTGKISAGQIDFTFGIPDGRWNSEVLAKKS